MKKIRLGKYQHFKGNFYEVLSLARHSETLEEMVVYRALYNHPEFGEDSVWVRPAKMFVEDVEVNGKKIPRFTYMEGED
jgi:cyclomaltodextrinase / maltogenic alpha-amylase / neopullulanase